MQLADVRRLTRGTKIYLLQYPDACCPLPEACKNVWVGRVEASVYAGLTPLHVVSIEESGYPYVGKWINCDLDNNRLVMKAAF